MTALVAGLIVFLGVHSLRIFAEPWRVRTIARVGGNAWKGVYSLVSIAGFVLLVWGYGKGMKQPLPEVCALNCSESFHCRAKAHTRS